MRCRSAELCSILIALYLITTAGLATAGEPNAADQREPSAQRRVAGAQRAVAFAPEVEAEAYAPRPYAPPRLVPLWARELPYKEGTPVPVGYHLERNAQLNYLVSGLVILMTSYTMSLFLSSNRSVTDDEIAALPFAGPFIAATTLKDRKAGPFAGSDYSTFNRAGMVFIGGAEIIGGSLIALSFAAGTDKLVRDEPTLSLSVAPSMGPGFAGLGITGSM